MHTEFFSAGSASHGFARSHHLSIEQQRAAAPLLPLFDNSEIQDVFVHCEEQNGQRGQAQIAVWVHTSNSLTRIHYPALAQSDLRTLARELIASGGKQLDELHPCVDVTIGEGIRVHAVLPPISTTGPVLSIRLPSPHRPDFEELLRAGMCTVKQSKLLRTYITRRKNILITGGTGSGKTTLLTALLGLVPEHERIITIEDVAEIRPKHPHRIALETRCANSEGVGEVTLDDLLREALRMKPDRIVLGECRGKEIATLFSALNTGHDGGLGTLHASELADVPQRIEALGALANLTPEVLARQAIAAIDAVVHLERSHGQYRIAAIGSLTQLEDKSLSIIDVTSQNPSQNPSPKSIHESIQDSIQDSLTRKQEPSDPPFQAMMLLPPPLSISPSQHEKEATLQETALFTQAFPQTITQEYDHEQTEQTTHRSRAQQCPKNLRNPTRRSPPRHALDPEEQTVLVHRNIPASHS